MYPKPVCVAGSINIDVVARVERLTLPGETLTASDLSYYPGGKGANQALAARRSGAAVRFVANRGNDASSAVAMSLLDAAGVDTGFVAVHPGNTGTALIRVSDKGENDIVVFPGANALWTEDEDYDSYVAGSSLLICQLEVPFFAVRASILAARKAGIPTLLNPSPFDPGCVELLPFVDILVLNDIEAQALSGTANLESALSYVESRGVKTCIITCGAEGCLVSDHGRRSRSAVFPVKAVDTTAAGDTFTGALAAGISGSASLDEAVRFACAAAAICVTRNGAQSSIPTKDEVVAFLSRSRV